MIRTLVGYAGRNTIAHALNQLRWGWEFSNRLFLANVKIDKTNDIYSQFIMKH